MNSEETTRSNWQEMIPRGRSAIVLVVIVAIVAFILGGLLIGGNGSDQQIAAGDGQAGAAPADTAAPTLWTCSMHPQIRLPHPGKCPICSMDLVPVQNAKAGESLKPNQIRLSKDAVELANIQTSPVTRGYAERSIRMVGKLDYDETRVAYITAWVPGRLDKLFVDYTGARVMKGEHMVHMYSPELIAAQEELLQAKKTVAALTNTSSALLKSTATETLKSAREKLRLYGLSEDQIKSIEQGNSPLEHITLTAPVSGIVIKKDAAEGMYVSTGTRIYTIADFSKLWMMLEAYESDLPWLRYGQHVSFTSPSFPGETFDAIISFIDPVVDPKTRTVHVRAVVDNADGRLKPEMFVSGTVKSRLDSEGHVIAPELAGKWIGPMHPQIVKDHPGKCDICGMDLVPAAKFGYASGKKTTGKAPLLIPATAPLITGQRAVVYVKDSSDDGLVFEGREITLGPRAQNSYIVKSGLKEGEQVVTNGAFKIDSELQIQAKPSMMSPEGGGPAPGHQHAQMSGMKMAKPEADTAHKMTDNNTSESVGYEAGSATRLDNCEKAQVALIPVYNNYFAVQMALADDDLDAAKRAFQQLIKSIDGVDMSLFKDEAHERWMKLSGALQRAASTGQASASLVDARDAFYHTSQAAIELHDTFGHTGGESFYLTFCPMARDNAGAFWLQEKNQVWNSFYGKKMLRCGEIKQELHADNAIAE